LDDQDDDRRARAPEPDDVVRICRSLNDADARSRDPESIERDGVVIPVPSPGTLIRMKDTPRPQDAIDRAYLEGVLRERAQRKSG
jgi:hypothetical protein